VGKKVETAALAFVVYSKPVQVQNRITLSVSVSVVVVEKVDTSR